MQIRSSKKIQSEVSLQDPIGVDRDGNEMTPSRCILRKLSIHTGFVVQCNYEIIGFPGLVFEVSYFFQYAF
jgi:hypothetical protein